jgi:hypothetical protein
MPCIRNDNGQAVPGAKGSCPIGTSWSDTADNNKFDWQDVGTFAKRRYFGDDGKFRGGTAAMDAATGAFFIPGVGWVAGGAMKAGAKGIPWLIGRLFGKKVAGKPAVTSTKTIPNYNTPFTAPKRGEHWAIGKDGKPYAVPFKPGSTFTKPTTKTITTTTKPAVPDSRAFSPLRSAATVGVGSQAVDHFFPFTERGIEAQKVREQKAATLATQKKEDETAKADAAALEAAKVQAEKDRVANLGFWEKMKEPGYWDETDATGLTRVEKIGQLLSYYGQTPKQRANTTSPADRWAEMTTENMATAAKIKEALLDFDNPMSKVGGSQLASMIRPIIEKRFGDTAPYLPWGQKSEKDIDSIADYVAVRINLYTGKGLDYDAAFKKAIEDYEKVQDQF